MDLQTTPDSQAWNLFLASQPWQPFLQSWTMGEVYRDIGQPPVRIAVSDGSVLRGICFAHIVNAKRGKHLSVPYGPVLDASADPKTLQEALNIILDGLKSAAKEHDCAFLRISPFWPLPTTHSPLSTFHFPLSTSVPSPLHLLAEHLWILPLRENGNPRTEEAILAGMRKTTRNLVRRAERDGVTVRASDEPLNDLPIFLKLHRETKSRHGFTPYTDTFFTSELKRFSEKKAASLYLASHLGEVIAASIHIHAGGETSYHHGASSSLHRKIPASYLLQWQAIRDALRRGDRVYNFWGIAPPIGESPKANLTTGGRSAVSDEHDQSKLTAHSSQLTAHPFSGVTLFKTGFGGELLELVHCMDIPLKYSYWLTRAFETMRKWRRGF